MAQKSSPGESAFKVWRAERFEADALSRLERRAMGSRSWGEAGLLSGFDARDVHFLLCGPERGNPAGFAVWRHLGIEAELLTIGTAPPMRRKGVGARLLDRVILDARASGAATLYLEVDAGNLDALRLYRAAGFEEKSVRKAYYRDGADALIMRRTL